MLALSTYATMRRLSRSDIQYRPYLHMLPREDSVDQIYNTDPIYLCFNEKTQFIRYTIPTLSTYVTKRRRSRSDKQYRSYLQMLPMRRLSLSDIQFRPYLHMLPMRRLGRSDIQYRPYLHMLPREDAVDQIYKTDPIYLHLYVSMRRLSSPDIQYRPYLHMTPW
jgi:hypothetical protein